MDNVFDVIVLGTGLPESIAAAALAKAGLKVAHVDPNPYYGADEATLTLDELVQWAETHSTSSTEEPIHYRVDYLSPDCPSHPKQYSISLSPSVIPSIGPFISSVISSGVARYGSYKLLGPIAIYRNDKFQSVPQSKESIFQDRSIPLVEKRRLMRFLVFASGEFEDSPELQGQENTSFDRFLRESFSLSEEISQVIMFSLASCNFSGESTLTALHRVRSCLRSAGRYGSSPFLVGYYGGSGEIIQGFCRAAAVNGGVYILGRKILNVVVNGAQEPERFAVELEDVPDTLRSSCILSSMTCIPRSLRSQANLTASDSNVPGTIRCQLSAVARCVAIVQGTLTPPHLHGTDDMPLVEGQSDSFLAVFPPGSLDGGSTTSSVTLLTAGAGTMSAPSGTSMASIPQIRSVSNRHEIDIIYLSMPLHERGMSSKDLLQPYLAGILDSNPMCQLVFQLFYMQHLPVVQNQSCGDTIPNFFVFSHLQPDVFQSVDQASLDAEKAFWSTIQGVGSQTNCKGFWAEGDNVEQDL
ncbi:GDP dissociation inhibitor-domain-containing protein [Boletus edulis BED1]|uniref:GDP dissociation inhibitor-domain-containing protein n=1 Tax=Boletus edulis BED1 TaxID=1328754 RepID=A0AAD4BK61_BOLED|nr:GDP dissociation inhibitor-domain-containing protein [Boletus edulis BED1]KAF8451027.1 GDP dissociation inhibitor-domain-containing protein [Boletus edulis BED1]